MKKQALRFAVLLSALTLWNCLPASAQSSSTADFWGAPVDGIQLHLAVSTATSNVPQPTGVALPRLEVQIRNQGANPVTLGFDFDLWNIEIDGIWYRTGPHGGGAPACRPVAPGAQITEPTIALQSNNLVEADPKPTGAPMVKLDLKPGKHSIRVRTTATNRCRVGSAPQTVSNSITVDVPGAPAR